MGQRPLQSWRGIFSAAVLAGALGVSLPSEAADFLCAAGDVACLIDAITQANGSGESNTITLEAGTYVLTAVNNIDPGQGANGLPVVTSTTTIQGAGMEKTIISKGDDIASLRLLHVKSTGTLRIEGLALRGGSSPLFAGALLNQGGAVAVGQVLFDDNNSDSGGAIFTDGGTMLISNTKFVGNGSLHGGGGIFSNSGSVTLISRTSFEENGSDGGGAIANRGTMVISDSAIVENHSDDFAPGGGINNGGTLHVINTTIARNTATGGFGGGAAITTGGPGIVTLTNSTVVNNVASLSPTPRGGGLVGSTFVLLNTIVALNTGGDCRGTVISLGNNLIGDPTGCTITLQGTDLTGDPLLGNFRDNGTPGNGHFPLRGNSPAINAGSDALCPQTDQLGQPRTGQCDIGAINFPGRGKNGLPKKKTKTSDHMDQ
jgi:predicted outer membrane repeat protein